MAYSASALQGDSHYGNDKDEEEGREGQNQDQGHGDQTQSSVKRYTGASQKHQPVKSVSLGTRESRLSYV